MRVPSFFVIAITMVLASNAVRAEWSRIGGNSISEFYIDRATGKRVDEHVVSIWQLYDRKEAAMVMDKPYLSVKNQYEFDCKAQNYRTLYSGLYAGPMGSGELVANNSEPDKLEAIAPGTVVSAIARVACVIDLRKASVP